MTIDRYTELFLANKTYFIRCIQSKYKIRAVDVEDRLSEAYIKGLAARNQITTEGSFKFWFVSVLLNVHRGVLRKDRVLYGHENLERLRIVGREDKAIHDLVLLREIEERLELLTPELRKVFVDKYFHGKRCLTPGERCALFRAKTCLKITFGFPFKGTYYAGLGVSGVRARQFAEKNNALLRNRESVAQTQ